MPSIEEIRQYIAELDLAERPAPAAAEVTLPTPPTYKPDVPQIITVGSQISEFAKGVPVELRSTIINSFLLAQLAADRWIETHPHSSDDTWYRSYLTILKKCGWLVERDETALQTVSGDGSKVHREIIKVLTLALGPVVSAASLVLGVVNGLAAMEDGQPFVTIFDRASQHAEAQLFQISYVDVGPNREPRINLAAYHIEANASATQILFFKFAGSNAKLRTSSANLAIDEDVLADVSDAIGEKVKEHIVGSVAEIEI
ncbi:MAG: hypothetical protein JWR51_3434 [Devosia sp.]|uniref:hypothetical protein n=1 Tax=Devosia sp. TaxID=1871048 RepID=UPI00263909EA|nr:hypothetical protein [Devosia sp.]MDB5530331.1 hypothetical protein [Devosia sp.]